MPRFLVFQLLKQAVTKAVSIYKQDIKRDVNVVVLQNQFLNPEMYFLSFFILISKSKIFILISIST
jgi:hypothetical protein